ncbi:cobalamin biosynthesis protein CbiM [Xanthobacteraceae bacterium Astr-EGSB]|uniref:cobalamin biosynthesis protein CbiM n=1 Tax=Astrobacterium formosum TaxID=3069710 RepID=UPI0027AE7A8B|nr:cobalamin biosynthesis protein CbiM [Xanthobacteraceae bacterium Astr-EGSB]
MNHVRALLGLFAAFALAFVLAMALALTGATSAQAHRLKLFVSVDGMTVSGYAFFIGGGRPQDVDFVVKDAAGAPVHRGRTDEKGAFAWTAAAPADYTLSLDTGDGHFADEKIPADRFSLTAPAIAAAVQAPAETPPAADSPASTAAPSPATIDPETLTRLVEAAAERAVARQLRPLIEAQNLAEARLRFNDIMGGVGMIVGLAGLAAWAMSRRRRSGGGP